jgi:hypothetical protein
VNASGVNVFGPAVKPNTFMSECFWSAHPRPLRRVGTTWSVREVATWQSAPRMHLDAAGLGHSFVNRHSWMPYNQPHSRQNVFGRLIPRPLRRVGTTWSVRDGYVAIRLACTWTRTFLDEQHSWLQYRLPGFLAVHAVEVLPGCSTGSLASWLRMQWKHFLAAVQAPWAPGCACSGSTSWLQYWLPGFLAVHAVEVLPGCSTGSLASWRRMQWKHFLAAFLAP